MGRHLNLTIPNLQCMWMQGLIQGYGQEGHGRPRWAKSRGKSPQFWSKSPGGPMHLGAPCARTESAPNFTLAAPMKNPVSAPVNVQCYGTWWEETVSVYNVEILWMKELLIWCHAEPWDPVMMISVVFVTGGSWICNKLNVISIYRNHWW